MKLPLPAGGALPMLCLPYAGGRATVYRGWADELPGSVQPMPTDYPRQAAGAGAGPAVDGGGPGIDGHDGDSVAAFASRLHEALQPWPRPQPLVLFGHSLGALVAYELALRLAVAGWPPRLLLVSGHRAPHEPPREDPAHTLSSPALQAWLTRWGGVPRALRHDPAALAAFEPAVREDLRLAETWQPPPPLPLPCPVVALAGLADTLAPPASMPAWAATTRGPFRLHALPGSHFFLQEQRPQFLQLLALEIERCTT